MVTENNKNYTLQKYLQEEAKSIEKYEFINGKMVKTSVGITISMQNIYENFNL